MHTVERPIFVDSIFTKVDLDPEELALACAITNWDKQAKWTVAVYEVHGRSIVFKSPTRTENRARDSVFSGIQLIGVGGTPDALKEGLMPKSGKPTPVYRVSSVDVSTPLERIFQLHEIDKNGKVQLPQRQYAPRCGMDEKEAVSRKAYTTHFFENVALAREQGQPFPFVVPKLVAEGFYTGMSDPQGKSLRFQAYRVPLIDRLPNQILKEVYANGIERGLLKLGLASYLFGKTLRILHDSGFAYMDRHLGNVSLIEDGEKTPRLYITDLGSVKEFNDHPFPLRHRGFDLLTHIRSSDEFLPTFEKLAKVFEQDPDELSTPLYMNAIGGYLQGYFPERFRGGEKQYQDQIINLTREVMTAYFSTHPTPQEFVEFFEDFYR